MLLDLLVEDQVLLDLVQENLVLANIATIEGLLFQCGINTGNAEGVGR